MFEVRVQTGFCLLLLGAMGLAVGSIHAQPAPSTTTPAASEGAEPATSTPPPNSVAAPAREGEGQVETRPQYRQQPPASPAQPETDPLSMPSPRQAPAPAVLPASPTPQAPYVALPPYDPNGTRAGRERSDPNGSPYIPVDSWVYPAMTRLYSMGYLDTMFLSLRPYTRRSALHILQASEDAILSGDDGQAQEILSALLNQLTDEGIANPAVAGGMRGKVFGIDSVYTRVIGVSGPILKDSYHLGQTFFNDYGRPEETGFNNITGFSTLNEQGPFSLYIRGEYQHAPAGPGYSQALSAELSNGDQIPFAPPHDPQPTIPTGPIAAQNPFRLVEATLSYHILGHEISGGKSDAWLGPGMGGAMDWSNNAENIYSFRINRVEPLYIKWLSKVVGPVRYDFFYGSLKGHTYPNDDYTHSEMVSFAPTRDFQLSLQRTIVFGGEGHEPVTLHTFLKGFFDTNDTNAGVKVSRSDPGARFSDFSFSYRLPFVRNYLTLYADGETHDDVFPISAPRRAAYRPGIFLARFPGARRLDLRVEGVSTDCSTLVCQYGNNEYTETIQKQAYTNKGIILGDWIGREAKGGQASMTYHLSGNEWVQVSYLNKKTAKDFIRGGTTQNQFRVALVKRIRPDIEINAWYQHEAWKAPVYMPGGQNDNAFTLQLTFFPKLQTTAR